MNIIELAKQAGFQDADWNYTKGLEKFAALVAAAARADERNSFYGQDKPAECVEGCPPNQICDYCQIAAPVKAMILATRADEREECAKLCETTAPSQINGYECAAAIRARGTT